MRSSLFLSALSGLAVSRTALAACLNCTSPVGNSDWANGVLAGADYYRPSTPQGIWGLGTSSNGEGPLQLRQDPSAGFYYVWNQCPKGHSGYCRVYLNQVIRVVAGETYNFFTEYALSNVRGQTANTFELYVETLPGRQRLFNEYTFVGNTAVGAWASWTTSGTFTAPTTADVLLTYTWRNDPNDAVVNIRRIDMKPVPCRAANPNTSCTPSSTPAPTSTSTSTTISTTPFSSSSSILPSSSEQQQPTSTPAYPPVQGYNWVDCWREPSSGTRLLRGGMTASDDMTLEKCATFCSAWPFFGTEYGRECFCGLSLTEGSSPAPLAECNFPCAGDVSQVCGAGGRLNLYRHPAHAPTNPDEIAGSDGNSRRLGCVTETQGGRTLGVAATASDGMTLEMCDAFCADFALWGVEYGRECYCGNELRQGAEVVGNEECEMLCAGNPLQLCGAGDRVMVYSRQQQQEVVEVN